MISLLLLVMILAGVLLSGSIGLAIVVILYLRQKAREKNLK